MAEQIELVAGDHHRFNCYVAEPSGPVRGVLLVLPEVFGVNAHIRAVADGYAADGYLAVAPALFDRLERGFEVGYEGADRERAIALMRQASADDAMHDVAAVIGHFKPRGPLAVVGYCWGGTMAWLAATRLPILRAAVCYYGSGIVNHLGEHLHCPTLCHFGERDASIPLEAVDQLRRMHPDATVHLYPADHGFNCDHRATWEPESARLARERTLAFLTEHLN
jgi:carboxymethylenebutenolidase